MGIFIPRVPLGFLSSSILNYDSMQIDEAFYNYHLWANETMNEFLLSLVSSEEVNVSFTESESECTEGNVSSYCLALILNAEFTELERFMMARRRNLVPADYMESGSLNLNAALEDASDLQSQIAEELLNAKSAMELSLNVYKQIQTVYPLHKELKKSIEALDLYNLNLAALRDKVELYPAHFHNVSTIYCK